jgi:aminobenzoyl-glutamate utilization protein B
MEETMYQNLQRLGPVPFDAADRDFAAKIQATLSEEDIEASYARAGVERNSQQPLCDLVVPLEVRGEPMIGSTDVGDVSWVVPTVQARVATHAIGTPGHSWQITAQGKSGSAHKGLIYAAKAMAGTAVDALADPGLIERAKADLARRTARHPYVCPIPADVQPPIAQRPGA